MAPFFPLQQLFPKLSSIPLVGHFSASSSSVSLRNKAVSSISSCVSILFWKCMRWLTLDHDALKQVFSTLLAFFVVYHVLLLSYYEPSYHYVHWVYIKPLALLSISMTASDVEESKCNFFAALPMRTPCTDTNVASMESLSSTAYFKQTAFDSRSSDRPSTLSQPRNCFSEKLPQRAC